MSKDLEPQDGNRDLISLAPEAGEIDISGLSDEAREELKKYAARKQIDLAASMKETQIDLHATSAAVGNMADATRRMSESGDNVTIRQSIENSVGKTEILMGNTEEAKRGDVDKGNKTWMYAVGGVVILLIVASVLGS